MIRSSTFGAVSLKLHEASLFKGFDLLKRPVLEILPRIAAHPAGAQLPGVSNHAYTARVVLGVTTIVVCDAVLDAFFVMSSDCA